ncbi:hypothetical protein [Natronogracilivirga saccharolytica]|uniref:Uncharacterized protein n=1 Tax=Natronogracilivirga saccharolytica TaxID=2812953 RepID=A0A8J7RLH0_9BACT|nr:hypothetical protein [Natronogracilivirga saccharolytica]MBP3193855.1 hypothetical protein [Natronogracilivirga saccharolytica]
MKFYFYYFKLCNSTVNKKRLKLLCKVAREFENHVLFERVCEMYANSCIFSNTHVKKIFIRSGYGEGALGTYRYVENTKGEKLFEKIVFAKSNDDKHIDLYSSVLQKYIVNIKIPLIVSVVRTNELVIYYYEYLNNITDKRQLSNKEKEELLLFYLKELYSLNNEDVVFHAYNQFNNLLEDQVVKEGLYYIRRANYPKWINNESLLKFINDVLLTKKHITLSHGDLSYKNFNKDGYLWDWDRAGVYPVGFDLAWGVVSSFEEKDSINDIYQIALRIGKNVYSKNICEKIIQCNVFVFILICYFRKYKIGKNIPEHVLRFIKSRYRKMYNIYMLIK